MSKTLKYQQPMSPIADIYTATVLKLSRDAQEQSKVKLDISYGSEDEQLLDLYLHESSTSTGVPVLLFIHGGAWTHGYKEWMGFMASAITCLPAIFVSVGYRLAPDSKFPSPLDDCRNALQWVYQNINRYGGDHDRIFVGGHSAGGHLAALITLQLDALPRHGLPKNVVKGCFPVSGVFDISGEALTLAKPLLKSCNDAANASPILHVRGNTVPFFIAVGENEDSIMKSQSEDMVSALKTQSGVVRVLEMKGCDHFQTNIKGGDIDGEWASTVRRLMA